MSLGRQVLAYGPATLIPAVTSFISVYIFTRIVSPDQYGTYALVMSVGLLSQSLFFYWLHVSTTRFIARAVLDQRLQQLTWTSTILYLFAAGALVAVYTTSIQLLPLTPALRWSLLLGVPLVLTRALAALNQSFNRGQMLFVRFNVVECVQAIVGFCAGIALVKMSSLGGDGIIVGLTIGALAASTPAIAAAWQTRSVSFSREQARTLLAFGLPLTAANAMNYVLGTSDRLLVEHYLDSAAVGVYAVSYSIADRTLSLLFMGVTMAAFPLAIAKLEHEGREAARNQLYDTGTLLLALTVPACAGFVAANEHIVAVLVGKQFQAHALKITPWIVGATLLGGLQAHFFDHAFHLARRTDMFVWTKGPAVLVNVVMNMVLLPRIGIMGAAYATVGGYAVSLIGSIVWGRRVFPIRFPFRPALEILAASVIMAVCIRILNLPRNLIGLTATVSLGIIIYLAAAVALNIAGLRTRIVQARLLGRQMGK